MEEKYRNVARKLEWVSKLAVFSKETNFPGLYFLTYEIKLWPMVSLILLSSELYDAMILYQNL